VSRAHLFALISGVVLALPTAQAQAQQKEASKDTPADDSGDSGREDRVIDRSRALGDRIKSVQRRAFIQRNRHELGVDLGLTMNDAFFVTYGIDAHYAYHILDSLALEARFQYLPWQSTLPSVRVVRQIDNAIPPLLATPLYDASLEAQFAPIYGKMSILSEKIIHYDLFVAGGFGVMATNAATANFHPMGTLAIGARVYVTDWLAVRAEIRDQMYQDRRVILTDVSTAESALQNFLFFNLGVSVFFPFTFDYRYE
jgi:outer membrane beta-barrel protein